MPTLVAGDVRGIQEYIFGSPRLLEMRGASALIDFFDRAAVPALIDRFGGRTVFSGGGNFLASFEDPARPAEAMAALGTAFFDLTGGDGLILVSHPCDQASVPELKAVNRRLRQAKRSAGGARPPVSNPFLKRCESCGRETADHAGSDPDGNERWLGPVCRRKHRMLARLRQAQNPGAGRRPGYPVYGLRELEIPAVTERLRGMRLPKDFQELAGDDDLALVVADANNLGSWFEERDLDGVQDLSKRVDAALRQALDAATEAAFPGAERPGLQVLICGGDDLVVALPARRGLDFAAKLLESFEVKDPQSPGRKAGMAAGLLFSRFSFPFRQAHGLAESLLGRAKARCREEGGVRSALDFHRVKGTQVQSLAQEQGAIEAENALQGWSYGAAGPYTPEELGSLRALAARLRKVSPSQRGRLREILSPRDDGEHTLLDGDWQVPRRVVAELAAWLLRQEGEPPFAIAPGPPSADLVRKDRKGQKPFHRLALADALLLADLGED